MRTSTPPFHPHRPPSRFHSRRGVALIITLAFLVLATFVAVAFMSKALKSRQTESTSSQITKTDLLARSAIEAVVSDLRAEVRAGSTLHDSDGVTVFQPTAPASILPQRVLSSGVTETDTNFSSLVKQSVGRFFPNSAPTNQNSVVPIIQAATGVSTGTASVNGRFVSGARWSSPRLIIGGGDFTNSQVPQWILVTRSGIPANQTWNNAFKNPAPSNQDFVIGRFAFNVYEVGGLLDANVAGHDSSVTSGVERGRKGSLGLASLESIPGVTNANEFVTNWRNLASGSSAANYLAYLGLSSDPTNDFFNQGPATGFLKPAANAAGNATDNMLIGRQDLIRLAEDGNKGITTDALPYLTHFTRTLNAPSWGPQVNASDMPDYDATLVTRPRNYADDANNAAAPNRFLPNVRVVTTFTRADGTTAQVGEPLIKSRFPLSRLAGIGPNGVNTAGNTTLINGVPSPATAATIQRDFGLVWSTTSNSWIYAGHTGSSSQAPIKTLAQVASENREPNFFELLKAGILDGSLGKSTAADTGMANLGPDLNLDLQILKIGANLIDQADADDVPMRIERPLSTEIVLGIENHPYIYTMSLTPTRRRDRDYDPANTANPQPWVTSIQQMQVWNPHLNASDTGRSYRIRALNGESRARIRQGGADVIIGSGTPQDGRFIAFEGNQTFAEPVLLTPANISDCSPEHRIGSLIGFHMGDVRADNNLDGDGDHRNDHGTASTGWFSSVVTYDIPVTLQLEVFDGGSWFPVQRLYPQRGVLGNAMANSLWDATDRVYGADENRFNMIRAWVKTDPRSQRFGFYGSDVAGRLNNKTMRPGPADSNQQHAWEQANTANGASRNANTNPGWKVNYPLQNINNTNQNEGYTPDDLSDNRPDSQSRVVDPDGVLRPADGTRATNIPAPGSPARPVVLDRAFRSVGEMGYALRDDPWKTLDFVSPGSADAALLDLFCLSEGPICGVTAGALNLNTRHQPVLKAVLVGTIKNDLDVGSSLTDAEVDAIVTDIIAETTDTPLLNRANLATQIAPIVTGFNAADSDIKTRRESVVRALADVGNTRTWNLMIDLIAQSGIYPPTVTGLNDFLVQGERRYWIHLAIDRFTGQIVAQNVEPVHE